MEKQEKIESSLKFCEYVVDEVLFKRNINLPDDVNSWKTDFDIACQIHVNEEKTHMNVKLEVEIFKKTEAPPFTMKVVMEGFFEMIGVDKIEKYKANAIAIMYPYLRALVSTYTANSNVLPLILPAINVNAMLEEK